MIEYNIVIHRRWPRPRAFPSCSSRGPPSVASAQAAPAAAKGAYTYMINSMYSTSIYSTLLYSILLYSTLLCSALLCSALLYSTLLYSTLLYSTLLYSTLLYSPIISLYIILYARGRRGRCG